MDTMGRPQPPDNYDVIVKKVCKVVGLVEAQFHSAYPTTGSYFVVCLSTSRTSDSSITASGSIHYDTTPLQDIAQSLELMPLDFSTIIDKRITFLINYDVTTNKLYVCVPCVPLTLYEISSL